MRKVLVPLAVVGLLAVPAAAVQAAPPDLRDPFQPLLGTEEDGTTTGGAPTGEDPAGEDPTGNGDPDPVPPDDGLPTTGSDTTSWLAGAYALISVGAGFVAAARVGRPRRRGLST